MLSSVPAPTDTHTACLLDRLGRQIAVTTVPAGAARCRMLLAWARRNAPGPRLAWAVEGTRSHGLGLTRYLRARDQAVTEAGRPPRASKRPGGKSGPADAARAARDALAAGKLAQPRANGAREALRILLAARCQATTARTAAVNTFKALILGAPDRLRQELRGLSRPRQTARCRTLRVHASKPVAEQVLRAGRRRLATHIRTWDRETAGQQGPAAPAHHPDDAGALGPARRRADERRAAAGLLVGPRPVPIRSRLRRPRRVSPLEASSGKITRHKLAPALEDRGHRVLTVDRPGRPGGGQTPPAGSSPAAPPTWLPARRRGCAASTGRSPAR